MFVPLRPIRHQTITLTVIIIIGYILWMILHISKLYLSTVLGYFPPLKMNNFHSDVKLVLVSVFMLKC